MDDNIVSQKIADCHLCQITHYIKSLEKEWLMNLVKVYSMLQSKPKQGTQS